MAPQHTKIHFDWSTKSTTSNPYSSYLQDLVLNLSGLFSLHKQPSQMDRLLHANLWYKL